MKKLFFIMMALSVSLSSFAQDDDMYFVPKKKSTVKAATQTYYVGSNRNVDEYNRNGKFKSKLIALNDSDVIDFVGVRGIYPDSVYADTLFSERYYQQQAYDDDFTYSRELDRWYIHHDPWFYGPAAWAFYGRHYGFYSPFYYTGYYGHYYDPWYYSWYDPWYYGGYYGGWYNPWYYGGYYGGYWGHPVYGHTHHVAKYTGYGNGYSNRRPAVGNANGNNTYGYNRGGTNRNTTTRSNTNGTTVRSNSNGSRRVTGDVLHNSNSTQRSSSPSYSNGGSRGGYSGGGFGSGGNRGGSTGSVRGGRR